MRRIIKCTFFSFVVALGISAPRATHLRGHTEYVGGAVFAPDVRHFASTSYFDHTVRIWDGVAREQLAVLTIEDKDYPRIAFSPDSAVFAIGGRSKVVSVRQTGNGTELYQLVGHTDEITAIVFSPDGTTLASGCANGRIKVWDLATMKEALALQWNGTLLEAIAFSPDGKFLAAAGMSGNLRLWDLKTGKEYLSLPDEGMSGGHLRFSPDGRMLCSVHQATMRWWDVTLGTLRFCELPEWLYSGDYIDAIAFSPDGRILVAGHEVNIGLWDVSSGNNTAIFPKDYSHHLLRFLDRFLLRPDKPGLDPDILAAAFKPNGDLMILGSQTCSTTVVMWRMTTVPVKK